MKYLLNLFIQNFSNLFLYCFVGFFLIVLLNHFYSIIKEKSDEDSIYDVNYMKEEDKKLHVLTLLNTKINRDNSDKAEYYVNKVYKEIYGSIYVYPQSLKRKSSNEIKRVSFANKPVILNE